MRVYPYCAVLLLSACALEVSAPLAVIGENGQVLRGTTEASLSEGGRFFASDGNLSCSGPYDAMTESTTLSVVVTCSDGRRGLATATRDQSLQSGAGTMRLNDGSDWTFVFGPAANAL